MTSKLSRVLLLTLLPLSAMAAGPTVVAAQASDPCTGRDVASVARSGDRNDTCYRYLQLRERTRKQIVAERYGGADPCQTGKAKDISNALGEDDDECVRMGGLVDAALAKARAEQPPAPAPAPQRTDTRPVPESRGPAMLGSGDAANASSGRPATNATEPAHMDPEKAILEAINDGGSDWVAIEGLKNLGSVEDARRKAKEMSAAFLDRVVGTASPQQTYVSMQLEQIALLGTVKHADGKPVFPAMAGMLPVAVKLAESAVHDPDAMLALSRMKHFLLRIEGQRLAGQQTQKRVP